MTEAPSERTRVKRLNKRAKYDTETVHGILDAMPVCSVGYVFKGSPYVTPTLQWREGDHIYWHGSSASRMLETVGPSGSLCQCHSDRRLRYGSLSLQTHSANYRSVMVLGTARKITEPARKRRTAREFSSRRCFLAAGIS